MSFGFSVGDFITAIEFANQIRKEFVDAPNQFKAISDDVRSLSFVLQDIDTAFPKQELNDDKKRDLEAIDAGCRKVLDKLQQILDNNTELSSETGGVGRRIKRVWKRFKWDPKDIDELRSRIDTNIGFLNAFNGRLARDNIVKLVQYQEDQGRQAILNWITPIDYAPQQMDFINRRQVGTGQWLLDSTEFQAWLDTDKTLFCPGIPGAGKTILASIVVEELNARFQNNKSIGIAYLYCNYQRKNVQNSEDLLASLLKQLTQGRSSLPDSVKSLYDNHWDKGTRPSFDEISNALQSVAALYSRVFIVIDALDECQVSGGCRVKFLSVIFAIQTKHGTNLFATSRFIPDIIEKFNTSTLLEIRAHAEDVRKYLDGRISQSESKSLKSYREEMKAEIIKAVDGMFLLAQLHFESISTKKTLRKIKDTLKSLPTGPKAYDYAYDEAMKRITGHDIDSKKLAKQALSWITCTKRPLTTLELQHALAIEVGDSELDKESLPQIEDIVSVCVGLVTIDEESNIIRLVHYTTQEYFQRTQNHWFPDAETDITNTCVTYLSFDVFSSGFCQTNNKFEERLQSNHLYKYAAQYWGHHARKAFTLSQGLSQAAIGFLESKAKVEASSQGLLAIKQWSGHSNNSQEFPKQMTGLHLVAYFGINGAMSILLEKGVKVDSKDSYGRTPLWWAAGNGHEAVVKLLLDKGAELDSKDRYDQTPLWWPSRKGQDRYGQTPLSWAAGNGHEAVVKLLLDKGAELYSKDRYGRMPLSWAAGNGHEAVVKLLLDKGAELDSKDRNDRTPLWWAAGNGHEAVVKLLLDKGAELDSKDRYGLTPLWLAARNGHEAVVKLLLDKGAELDSKDSYGQTPLWLAAENGHEAVVKLLLDKGADK